MLCVMITRSQSGSSKRTLYQNKTQENLIEFLVQTYLSYICQTTGLCYMLRSQEVNLVFPIFFSYFYFIFNLFSLFYLQNQDQGQKQRDHTVTQQVTSGDSNSHKSWDTWKDIEGFRRSNVIQHVYCMLTSCLTYGTLEQDASQLAQTMQIGI